MFLPLNNFTNSSSASFPFSRLMYLCFLNCRYLFSETFLTLFPNSLFHFFRFFELPDFLVMVDSFLEYLFKNFEFPLATKEP